MIARRVNCVPKYSHIRTRKLCTAASTASPLPTKRGPRSRVGNNLLKRRISTRNDKNNESVVFGAIMRSGNPKQRKQLSRGSKNSSKMSIESQKEILDSIGKSIGVRDDDYSPWYSITIPQLIRLGAWRVLGKHSGSVYAMLSEIYPDQFWLEIRLPSNPRSSLMTDPECVDAALLYIEAALELKGNDDWYRVSSARLIPLGIYTIIIKNGGLYSVLCKYRPLQRWLLWKFEHLPQGASSAEENIKMALLYVEETLGFSSLEGWYSVTERQLRDLGVLRFFAKHGFLLKVLRKYRGATAWIPWKFSMLPARVSRDPIVINEALNHIEDSLGIKAEDDWYQVSQLQLRKLNVYPFIVQNDGLFRVLQRFRPHFDWKPWRFNKLPSGLSRDPESINIALNHIESELSISIPEDWYRVSGSQLDKLGVRTFILQNGGLFNVLKVYRSSFKWIESNFIGIYTFGEKLLGAYLRQIWPSEEIVEDSVPSGFESRVSFYIPRMKLAVLYQSDVEYGLKGTSGAVAVKLNESLAKVNNDEITIIFVPFWWDKSLESLLASILAKKPEWSEALKSFRKSQPISDETIVHLSNWRKSSKKLKLQNL